jgi:fatty acid desaturase
MRTRHETHDTTDWLEREGRSSVAYGEGRRHPWGGRLKIAVAWLFFAALVAFYSIVPILSIAALPAIIGIVGLLSQAYQSADAAVAARQHDTSRPTRPRLFRPAYSQS